MKRKLIIIAAICSLFVLLSACDARDTGSLKSLTRPYIAQYECTDAKLGNDDLLEKFDYIKIVLVDKNKLQLIYKLKMGEKRVKESEYTFDAKTRELSADIGIFGYRFNQTAVVKDGKFTVTKTILGKQLVMNFESV